MGPKPPEKLVKLSPKAMREAINAIRDYAVATHLENVEPGKRPELKFLPSGALLKVGMGNTITLRVCVAGVQKEADVCIVGDLRDVA